MPKLPATNQQQNNRRNQEILGTILFAVGIFMLLGFFGLSTGAVGEFINKVIHYLFGLAALLAPLAFVFLGIAMILGKNLSSSKVTLISYTLFVLCILSIVHHLSIPVGEELVPENLPLGGGLIGALVLVGLRKPLGIAGALVVLTCAIFCFFLYLSNFSYKAFINLFSTFKHDKDNSEDKEIEILAEQSPQNQQKTISRTTNSKDKYFPYDNGEFSDFTDNIQATAKPSIFKKILNNTPATASEEPDIEFSLSDSIEEILAKTNQPLNDNNELGQDKDYVSHTAKTRKIPVISHAQAEANSVASNIEADTTQAKAATVENEQQNVQTEVITDKHVTATSTTRYAYPPLKLLNPPYVSKNKQADDNIIREQCHILEQTLEDFRVNATVIAVTKGPSVTRFELEPAPGVKVTSIVNLQDDIALKLAAPGVRIEAPIPGKAAIGIEVPNVKNEPVFFSEIVIDHKHASDKEGILNVGLGKDISGNKISFDISKMPHVLVAGSTGSGKSVCINTIIAGLLYKASPEQVKLILVDPKVVELSSYNGIPHLLTPVVTDSKQAASALHWAVSEMERRYKTFADTHARDIDAYNKTAAEKMPFIVIIIDELADLMMVAKIDVEDAILRLAQKARAAGIHLILATQRPSVDVITGIVKANIPSRIAFAVSSQTDSRTILDMGGAEKLLGKGDMLFYPIGYNKPIRVQGAFVSDKELNNIVAFIKNQALPTEYSEDVTHQALTSDNMPDKTAGYDDMRDELFEDALYLVMDTGQGSASMLQRKFRIGYTRAARIIDYMEDQGIISHSVGSKPRELIMPRALIEDKFLKSEQ